MHNYLYLIDFGFLFMTDMENKRGEIIIYQTEDGDLSLEVQLQDETVWLTQAQMAELFQRDQSVISRHVRNIFKEGELVVESNMQKMHIAHSDRPVSIYNLEVIISVGYRVKSFNGTRFRIWATSVLKEHLIKGYTAYEKRLAEKGLAEMEEAVTLLSRTLDSHSLITDEGRAVIDVISRYAKSWTLLLKYDENRLEFPKDVSFGRTEADYSRAKNSIEILKSELLSRNEATDLFGQERDQQLSAILGNIMQTFESEELYPGLEEKAAHLLYFIVKDHPFIDGNKRIGAFLFLLFLSENGALKRVRINDNGLIALTLLIAESESGQKELMIKLILNLLSNP